MPETQNDNARVSIVIPVFNGGCWLAEAIDSALAQTWPDIEVIVVNDGSSDGVTDRIARSYGDQIRYLTKPRGGVSTALNAGVEAMSGHYFSWLSHDDRYRPKKIERQMEALAVASGNSIAFGDVVLIDQRGRTIRRGGLLAGLDPDDDPVWVVLLGRLSGCTLLVPRRCFDLVGGFDEGLPDTQDYDLWFRLARRFSFLPVDACDVESRQHPAQESRQRRHIDQVALLWRDMLDMLSDDDMRRLGGTREGFFERLTNTAGAPTDIPAVSAMIDRRRGASLHSLRRPEAASSPPVQPVSPPAPRQDKVPASSDAAPSVPPAACGEHPAKRAVRAVLLRPRVLRATLAAAEGLARIGGAPGRRAAGHLAKSLLHLHGRIDDQYYRDRYGRYGSWSESTLHYLRYGWHLGWTPHPDFDHERFHEVFPAARNSHLEPLSWLGIHRPDLLEQPIGQILGTRQFPQTAGRAKGHDILDGIWNRNRHIVLYLYSSTDQLACYWARQLVDTGDACAALVAAVDKTDDLVLSRSDGSGPKLSVSLPRDAPGTAWTLRDAGLTQVTIVGTLPDCPVLSGFLDALAAPLVAVVTDTVAFSRPWGRSLRPRPPRDAGRCHRILTPHRMIAEELGHSFPELGIRHASIREWPDPYRYRVRVPALQQGEALRVAIFDTTGTGGLPVAKAAAGAIDGDGPLEFACVATAGPLSAPMCEVVIDLRGWAATSLTYALCAWDAHVAWIPRETGPEDHLLLVAAMINGLPIATIDTPYARCALMGRPGSWLLPATTRDDEWMRFLVELRGGDVAWRSEVEDRRLDSTSALYAPSVRAA